MAEAQVQIENADKIPPVYISAQLLPLRQIDTAITQTDPIDPNVVEVGTLTNDLEWSHTQHTVLGIGVQVASMRPGRHCK